MLTPFHPIMEPITKLHPCLMNASLNVHVIFQVLKYMYIHAAAKPMQYSQCTRVLAAVPRCPYSLHRRTGWLDIWIGMWLVCCMTVGALECVHHPRLPQGTTVRISIQRWVCVHVGLPLLQITLSVAYRYGWFVWTGHEVTVRIVCLAGLGQVLTKSH